MSSFDKYELLKKAVFINLEDNVFMKVRTGSPGARPMIKVSALLAKYHIGKTTFYRRRDYLMELGYNMKPRTKSNCCFYNPEQVHIFDELDAHIKAAGRMDGFPPPVLESRNKEENAENKVEPVHNGGGLVHTEGELIANESPPEEEIYVETNPLEDIKEQNLRSVDAAAQHFAAQNLAALNYLTVDYMNHRQFSIAGLKEQVEQSEQVVKQSFTSVMESPEATTKKLLNKIRQRRNK